MLTINKVLMTIVVGVLCPTGHLTGSVCDSPAAHFAAGVFSVMLVIRDAFIIAIGPGIALLLAPPNNIHNHAATTALSAESLCTTPNPPAQTSHTIITTMTMPTPDTTPWDTESLKLIGSNAFNIKLLLTLLAKLVPLIQRDCQGDSVDAAVDCLEYLYFATGCAEELLEALGERSQLEAAFPEAFRGLRTLNRGSQTLKKPRKTSAAVTM